MENDKNEVSVQIKTQAEDANQSVTKLISNLSSLNANIEKISNSLDKIDSSSKKASNSVKGTKDALNQMSSISSKLQSSFNTMFNVGKFYLVWNVTKRIRDSMISLINSSIDYIETQNLFDVSMANQSDKAYKFMNTMANTFGMARTELMNYQASFNNVMKSLPGLSDETAYALSETLMKMSADYASLFNFTLPKAMEKFQAAVVGSVKPIRDKTGMDITEKTIQQVAKNIGVEKTVGQLNQVEKRLLRIISLQSQLNEVGAIGDFAKTIESPSNQLKVLQQQIQELGVWLGNVFIGTIGKVLPYINGFVMALVAMAKALAIFVGYSETKYDDPLQVEDTTNSVTGLNNSLDNATSSAKKLKKVLMGFDVLNVITTPTEKDSTSSSTSVDPKIIAALQEYDNLMSNVHMKAMDVRDTIMEWLGFEKEINSETGEITWKLKDGHTNLMKIKDAIIAVITVIAGITIIKKLIQLIGFIKDIAKFIGLISKSISTLANSKAVTTISKIFSGISGAAAAAAAAVALVVAVFIDGYENDEKFRESVDKLINSFKQLYKIFSEKIKPVLEKALPQFKKDIESIKKQLEPVINIVKDIIKLNLGVGITGLTTAISVLSKLLEGDFKGALEEVGKGISDLFDVFKEYYRRVKSNLSEIKENIKKEFEKLLNDLLDLLEKIPFFGDIIKKAREVFDKIQEIKDKIEEIFTTLFNWAKNNIKSEFIDPILDRMSELKDNVAEKFEEIKQNIKDKLQPLVDWIDVHIKNPIQYVFYQIGDFIENIFSSVSDTIERVINKIVSSVNNLIVKVNRLTGKNIELLSSYKSLGEHYGSSGIYHGGGGMAFADGGFPTTGEMFVAREAGPELVGRIGNRTAVMNNQQIVESVSRGVAQAVSSVMGQQGGSYHLYIDGQELTDVVTRRQNRNKSVMGV